MQAFLIGRAIDESAQHYELSEGAFIWALPSACNALHSDLCDRFCDGRGWHGHNVPLKLGGLNTICLDMLHRVNSKWTAINHAGHRLEVLRGIDSAFQASTALPVVMKRQNTLAYLRRSEERFYELHRSNSASLEEFRAESFNITAAL